MIQAFHLKASLIKIRVVAVILTAPIQEVLPLIVVTIQAAQIREVMSLIQVVIPQQKHTPRVSLTMPEVTFLTRAEQELLHPVASRS